MTVLVVYQLLWWQLFLDQNWVRDPWRGYDHLGDSLTYALIVEVVLGILLAVWVGSKSDVSVYLASMYLDASVLGLKQIPVIGPRSRPFSMSLVLFISMGIRTVALVVPGLLRNGCLVVCHTHPGGQHAHDVGVAYPAPHEAGTEGRAASPSTSEGPLLEGVTVHRPDASYGALDQRAPAPSH